MKQISMLRPKFSFNQFRENSWLIASLLILAGCSSEKEKPLHERGWLGGEYHMAKAFPKNIAARQPAGVMVGELRTNTPAAIAGLREGDLILELNHTPVTRLKDFRRTIDHTTPGTMLAVTASRDGETADYQVPVGREKFRPEGNFTICLPSIVHGWKLWPAESYPNEWKYWPVVGSPGFSAVFAGFTLNPGYRHEIDLRKKDAHNEDYEIWLAIMQLSKGERVVAQEIVEAKR